MVNAVSFQLILGTALGFLSGIGVGGGSLLMLWLTIVMAVPQGQARLLNLVFFIPAALVACLFRWNQGALNLKAILPATLAGCLAALFFSWLGTILDANWLKKGFGMLLLFTGMRELKQKSVKNGSA